MHNDRAKRVWFAFAFAVAAEPKTAKRVRQNWILRMLLSKSYCIFAKLAAWSLVTAVAAVVASWNGRKIPLFARHNKHFRIFRKVLLARVCVF